MPDNITVKISEKLTLSLTRPEWITARARINNALRTEHKGAPRSDERCPCQMMTLKRAAARGHKCSG